MAEVYTNQFLRDLTSNYTAGSGSLSVSSAAPVAVQSGTFRVRLANSANTLLKVTGGASTTTWTVTAEANDANCTAASAAVLGGEVTAGMLDQIRADDGLPTYYQRVDPTTLTFSWRNQSTATVTSRTRSIYLYAPPVSGDQVRGQEIAATSPPVSITVGLVPHIHNQNYNGCGLYASDGTKVIGCAVSNGGGLGITAWNNASSWSSNPATVGLGGQISPIYLKVLDSGGNLSWYWSPNGYDFIQIYSAGRTAFLASVANFGFYANSNNGSWPCGVLLISWSQGTS